MSKEYQETSVDNRTLTDKRENTERRDPDENRDLMDITGYVDAAWKCIKRSWPWFLVIISLCSTIGWGIAKSTYTPAYTASSTFIVNTKTSYSYMEDSYNQSTASQLSKTFPYIISNSAMQHLLEEDLGVDSVPGKITATALQGTNLITISVQAASGQLAYDILQSVLRNYPTIGRAVIGSTTMRIVEETGVPTSPSNSGNFRQWAKFGFLAGAALCCVWIFLSIMARKTIVRKEDLTSVLNLRCLAVVPKVQFKKRKSKKKNLVLIDNNRVADSFKEAIRTVRARVERSMEEEGYKVFLVSSANAGEGKTTFSVNLAQSLAEKGKRVILMDLDLRNPSVMKTFGVREPRYGINEVIQGKAPLNNVLEGYGNTTLKIIPGGKPIQLTSRVLTNPAMEIIFKALRAQADVIIVDTPPCGLLSDSALIAKYVDAGIFVVRQDYTSVERIKEGIEMLSEAELPLVGSVLNYAQAGITKAGSGYGTGKYGYSKA